MTPDRIRTLFEGMRNLLEGGVDDFARRRVMDAMIGRGLETLVPVLEAAHDRLVLSGTKSMDIGEGRSAWVARCPEGPFGGVWRKAVVVEDASGFMLVVLELTGEPDPAAIRMRSAILKGRDAAGGRSPGAAGQIRVYFTATPEQLTNALLADSSGKWSESRIMEASVSEPSRDGEAWDHRHASVLDSEGRVLWPSFFRKARALVDAVGLQPASDESVAAMAARTWRYPGDEGRREDPARVLALEALAEDGGLPGEACAAMLRTLDDIAASDVMRVLTPHLGKISDHLEKMGIGRIYRCNEGRHEAWLMADDTGVAMSVADQENLFVAKPVQEAILLSSVRTGGLHRREPVPCLDIRFVETDGGVWRLEGAIDTDTDRIRAWSAFHHDIIEISLAIDEEFGGGAV